MKFGSIRRIWDAIGDGLPPPVTGQIDMIEDNAPLLVSAIFAIIAVAVFIARSRQPTRQPIDPAATGDQQLLTPLCEIDQMSNQRITRPVTTSKLLKKLRDDYPHINGEVWLDGIRELDARKLVQIIQPNERFAYDQPPASLDEQRIAITQAGLLCARRRDLYYWIERVVGNDMTHDALTALEGEHANQPEGHTHLESKDEA